VRRRSWEVVLPAVDPFDAGRLERLVELIGNGIHDLAPSEGRRIGATRS
jgi:hypothetical protein